MTVQKIKSSDGGGWIVVVRGFAFVTRSALVTFRQACAIERRFYAHGYRRAAEYLKGGAA